MKKRAWKRIISTLLIVCMLAGVAPVTQMQQVEAFDILGIAEKMGCVVRGGMNAYETAKKENWDAGEAFFGTFKNIGKEMLGIGKDESPGSTVIVNQVDLSEVESELASIQNSLDKQSISLKKLENDMQNNTKDIKDQIEALGKKIEQTDQKRSYEDYLNNYFNFYNKFLEATARCETTLESAYTEDSSQGEKKDEIIKNAYDRVYELKGIEYTGDYYSLMNNMGKYIQGKYEKTNPGSVIDILCAYYKLAGYSDSQIAEATKQFVAQTYYSYCLANYYYMALILYQNTYIRQNNLGSYQVGQDILLSKSEIKNNLKTVLETNVTTTAQMFYDLNKHFCSVENQKVLYQGDGGTTNRTLKDSQMDVEPGSSASLPESEQILDAYFGSKYSKIFGNVCKYSYETSDNQVQVDGNKLTFDENLAEGKEIKVDMYCTVSGNTSEEVSEKIPENQKIKLHTYTFTIKAGKLSGGYGTVEYPYVIKTLGDYDKFSRGEEFSNAIISLEADLDFSTTLFNPVSREFTGQFFGNGHKFSNIDITGISFYGMFTNLSGAVQDLIIENENLNPQGVSGGIYRIGVIAGKVNKSGRIERCEVVDSKIIFTPGNSGKVYVGGIAGMVNGGSITGCITRNVAMNIGSPNGSVKGNVGGLVGYMDNSGTLTYSGREGGEIVNWCTDTESPGSYTGGLIGSAYSKSKMNNCWSFRKRAETSDSAYNRLFGTFVGMSSGLTAENCIVYSGTDADESNYTGSTSAKVEQGNAPQVRKEENFNCDKIGYGGAGYLTNDSSTGNPLRLKPLELILNTDSVKEDYYYGEKLRLNGLTVTLKRGSTSIMAVGLYDVDTTFSSDKTGTHTVKISVGNLNSSFQVTVAKKPHNFQQTVKDATCTENGVTSYKCTDAGCNETLKEQTKPALGHDMTKHEGTPATCQKDGEKTYWKCNRCKKLFLDKEGKESVTQEQLVIPKSDEHAWSDWEFIGEGKHKRHCTTEGCTAVEEDNCTTDAPKEKVIKATTSKDGKVEKQCSVCGNAFSSEVLPKASGIKIAATSYTYNGKVKTPSVTVKNSKGKTLAKTDYSIAYAKGRKNVGSYTVTITLKNNYSGTVKKTFKIVPKTTSISKLTAGKKKLTVKWKKQATQTTGYQLQYGTSSKFKGAKTATITKNKTVSKAISKLKAKKKYYVRIRTYKTVKVNGKSVKLYSAWSKAKSGLTK